MLYAIKRSCFRPRLDGTSNIHIYKPDLDIYSLDELVRKAEQENVEEEKKIQDAIRTDVYKQIELYIQAKEKNMCKEFPAAFRNTAYLLKCYQTARTIKITFDSFTADFYQDFVD